jgi:hypothetical protein
MCAPAPRMIASSNMSAPEDVLPNEARPLSQSAEECETASEASESKELNSEAINASGDERDFYTAEEVCRVLHISRATLDRRRDEIPGRYKPFGRLRYERMKIDEFRRKMSMATE